MAVVVDASVALAWSLDDEKSAYADKVLGAIKQGEETLVPQLWAVEMANALLVCERRQRLTAEDTAAILADLRLLAINVDPETGGRAAAETINLARDHNLSVYDATYLELANRRGASLATLDKRLKAAAKKIKVPTFK